MELIHTVQRIREVGDSPDSAGTDDAERNEIRRYRVAHVDPLDHAAAGIFSIVRPTSMTHISSSSCLINKLKSNAPCADLSSVIKLLRWTFISSSAFRFPSLTYAPTIRSIASAMCENYKTPRGRHDRTLPPVRLNLRINWLGGPGLGP